MRDRLGSGPKAGFRISVVRSQEQSYSWASMVLS
jgi:hypothetical protein